MRHPHPLMYFLVLGTPLFAGALGGIAIWTRATAEMSTATLLTRIALAVCIPVGLGLLGFAILTGALLYLFNYRVGNRVQIMGGEYSGQTAVVTRYHGVLTNGWISVRLEHTGLVATVSPYQCRKFGWRSYIL